MALPKIGFVGIGAIAEALIEGLCLRGEQRGTFLLSPRNATIAGRLADRYPFVTVAGDNQAVVDGSDIVFLAVRPQIAEDVLSDLAFRADQRVVSLIATFPVARLAPLVAPATRIARAVPLPPVARREGALTLYPPTPEVAALLDGLGQLVQLDREADIDACLAVTALMGSYFGMLGGITGWLSQQGLPEDQARPYVAAIFAALGNAAAAGEGFDQLVTDHSTPGGLNEQAWRELRGAGWAGLMDETLDLIHARIGGRATLADTLPPRA